jgi:signal recognition particle subunit SRP54
MLKLIPGLGSQMQGLQVDDKEFGRIEGIVHSMTLEERRDPDLIDGSRRRRIAKGCGVDLMEVSGLIKTFERTRQMMKSISGGAMGGFKSLLSGKMDMVGMMNSGKKIKQRSHRKKIVKRRGKTQRR